MQPKHEANTLSVTPAAGKSKEQGGIWGGGGGSCWQKSLYDLK